MPSESFACTHRPPCPGCPRLFEAGLPAASQRVLDALADESGLATPRQVEGAPTGFRVRARLSVRGRAASPKIGIFQQASHRIVDIPNCLVHHPAINRVVAALKRGIRETDTPPYADRPHVGALRNVQLVVERSSARVQLTLVGNATSAQPLERLIDWIQREGASDLHSLWWNGNPERTNTILGPHWHHVSGPEAVHETIAGASVFYPPGAFGQSNLDLAEVLIEELASWVPDASRISEFYAGCGAIGLGLAARSAQLSLNELGPDSLRGLEMGIAALGEATAARTRVVRGAAGEASTLLEGADVVIADPPRKGLDAALLQALCDIPPPRFIYASCGIDSFAHDANVLLSAGGLRLRSLSTYALFRHTEHVETLALFERT